MKLRQILNDPSVQFVVGLFKASVVAVASLALFALVGLATQWLGRVGGNQQALKFWRDFLDWGGVLAAAASWCVITIYEWLRLLRHTRQTLGEDKETVG